MLLALVASGCFVCTVEESKPETARLQVEKLSDAAQLYEFKKGEPPTSMKDLLDARIIDQAVQDPWGNNFIFSGAPLEIRSAGPDGKPNTADDITNAEK